MPHEMLPELSTICTLPCNVSLNVTSLWTWPECYWQVYGSQTVVHPSARVCQGERQTLWTQT